jgi:hypothetical protein
MDKPQRYVKTYHSSLSGKTNPKTVGWQKRIVVLLYAKIMHMLGFRVKISFDKNLILLSLSLERLSGDDLFIGLLPIFSQSLLWQETCRKTNGTSQRGHGV